jgi:hypothetical protein
MQYYEASPLYQRAVAGYRETLGSDHPEMVACSKRYSKMLDDMEQKATEETGAEQIGAEETRERRDRLDGKPDFDWVAQRSSKT